MLFISRTDAGVTQPDLKAIDIAAVVRDACGLFQASAEEKGMVLTWQGPERLAMTGDIRLVQRMVANLLDNAIKYTPAGGSVDVTLGQEGPDGIRIVVRDTGPGISPKDLPHVFERFYRGDPSRSQAGWGLGLSFARAVARAHGGDITAESSPAGSAFFVKIPSASA